MTPYAFGQLLAAQLEEKQATGEVQPLQSPAAGYREELFRQKQLQQQQQQPQGVAQPKAAADKTAMTMDNLNARIQDLYQRGAMTAGDLATTYMLDGAPAAAARGASMAGSQIKDILRAILAKYHQISTQAPASIGSVAENIARTAPTEKDAGLASGAMNFGRGMLAATKPITGLLGGGLGGMGRGFQTAGKMMYSGGQLSPAAMAGAGLAAYGMYNSLQNPIQRTGNGVRVRSPVRIPATRWRSPMVASGGGVNIQSPVKVLW